MTVLIEVVLSLAEMFIGILDFDIKKRKKKK